MSAAAGALLGLLLCLGVMLAFSGALALRAPDATRRIAPFTGVGATVGGERGVLGTLLSIAVGGSTPRGARQGDGGQWLERVAIAGAGLGGGVVLGVVVALRQGTWAAPLILGSFGVVIGSLLHDRARAVRERQRARRISVQLPTVAELLAFAVAAGESPVAALERVASTVNGELGDEVRRATAEIRAGASVEASLRGLADRCSSPDTERFVDGLLVAMERGTPLADVLRAQAADSRAAERRRLVELAGRKDVAMLVPVVFLILPTVVLIAMFPGYQALRDIVP